MVMFTQYSPRLSPSSDWTLHYLASRKSCWKQLFYGQDYVISFGLTFRLRLLSTSTTGTAPIRVALGQPDLRHGYP